MTFNKKKLKPFELLEYHLDFKVKILFFLMRFPRFLNILLYGLRPLYLKKETWYNKWFRWIFLTLGAGSSPTSDIKAMKHALMAVTDNFRETLDAVKNKKKIAWVEWILNPEICEAFDLISFNPEVLNVFANTKGLEYPPMLIEAAENQGTPIENCSAQKLAVGSLILKQIPEPSIILGGSHPCDTSITIYQTLEYLTNAPSFIMDFPYWKDEESYKYYEKCTWEQIEFLEKNLGKKINWDRLKQLLDRVNEINEYLREICEMARAVPCPSSISSLTFAWAIREVNLRSPHVLHMIEEIHKDVKRRFKLGQGIVKKEKVRVLLWFPPIPFFFYYFKWMEEKFGAVVVADFIGHVSTIHIDTSTPEKMVRDLAVSQMHLAMGRQCHGPIEFFTDEMVQLIDEYKPDCMIFSGHNGCKHGWAGLKIVQDICKMKNLPTLYLNLDIMDQRHTTEQELKNQTEAFFKNHGWA